MRKVFHFSSSSGEDFWRVWISVSWSGKPCWQDYCLSLLRNSMFQVDSLSNKGFKKIFCLLLSQLCTAFVFILCWYNIIIVSCKCWAFTADSCWEMMLSWIMLANTVLWCDQFSAPIINSQLLPLREAKTRTDERNSVVEAVGADVLYRFLCSLQTHTIRRTKAGAHLHRDAAQESGSS